jgi:phosphohistidine phosphatase
MKILVLIRHAKSNWDNPGIDDFDRPLNKRGKRDAPFMGERLRTRAILPDLIVSSPAIRARKTVEKIAHKVGYPQEAIIYKPNLYLPGFEEFVETIHSIDDNFNKTYLVSHNPGITELAYILSKHYIENIPTSGVFAVKFDVKRWVDVKTGEFLFFEYPKMFLS